MQCGPYLGAYDLDTQLNAVVLLWNLSQQPSDPSNTPSFRIYGQSGLMPNGVGSLVKADTQAVTTASGSPIDITCTNHGLSTGTRVNVSGVLGNTAADTETTITVVGTNDFTLDGTASNGTYTSGGVVHVAGVYLLQFQVASGNGFIAGGTYQVLIEWKDASGNSLAQLCSFTVV